MLPGLCPIIGGSVQFSITNTENPAEVGTDATTHTYTNVAIGAAHMTRIVVATFGIKYINDGLAVTSGTIGGVAASVLNQTEPSNDKKAGSAMLYAAVPTGTTATITVTASGLFDYTLMSVYSILGCDPTPTDSGTARNADPIVVPLNVSAGGGAITVSRSGVNTTGTLVGINVEDTESHPSGFSHTIISGHGVFAAAQAALNTGVDWVSSNNPLVIGISFAPAATGGWGKGSNLRSSGTNIGDMTVGGGLAAAFDAGTTESQATAAASAGSAPSAYIGKTYSARIYSVQCYGDTVPWVKNPSPSNVNVTLTLYGKQGAAPSSSTNGTSLGSTTFAANATVDGVEIVSSDQSTVWDHFWVRMATATTQNNLYIAELQFFEAV